MKNLKVKQFKIKVDLILTEQKNRITNEVANHIEEFKTIDMVKFTNEHPYNGDFKNKIFLIYHDHYRYNSGVSMSIGTLTHPHIFMEDRGYIKGVATNLDGYLKLRSAKRLNHNFNNVARIFLPKFKKSKHSEAYRAECDNIVKGGLEELNLFVLEQQKVLNDILYKMTNCSLLHYLMDI